MAPELPVRRATAADVPALTRLVNACFAVEASFVDGDRTDEAEVRRLLDDGELLVIDGTDGALDAAVFVRARPPRGYFGMLSVAPALRGQGTGRRLVALAEARCAAAGCEVMELRIVNLREELGPWYARQGYQVVGPAPYVARPVKRACHFVEMRKALSSGG